MKDSIIQFDKERRFHTMKLANRIFLFFGALSVISFVQFNAMAKCSETPNAGEYCGGTSVKDCIPGCYCIGGNKNAVGVAENNLKNFCTEKQSANTNQTDKMNQAGIYLCSNSAQFSKEKAVSSLDCKDVEWCNKQPDSGKYCERKYKTSGSGSVIKSCPDGCWCEGKAKGQKAVGILNPFSSTSADTIPLVAWCGRTGSNRVHNLESYLNDRGVHYCPDDFPHSDSASEKITNCYAKANDTGGFGKMYYGQVTCAPGRFLQKGTGRSGICIQCTSGSYCEGGTFIVSYKENQGIESCPSGYSSGPSGATKVTDCKNSAGQNYVAPVVTRPSGLSEEINHVNVSLAGDLSVLHCPAGGKYWNGNECDDCPPGSYCPANDDQTYACTGTRKYSTGGASVCSTCSMAQRANSDNTGCITAPVLLTSEEVARQRIEPNDLVAHEALCLDSQSHKVSFLPGADDADGTMNPVYNCTGDTVTLPSSGFTRDDYQFDKWNCNGIGSKRIGEQFVMPNADVNCTAQWSEFQAETYTVQYTCGDGTGTEPTDSNLYASGALVTLKSKGNCTAPSSMPDFDGWNCGNNIVGNAGDTITMPAANMICTAQWTDGTPQDGDDPETPVSCTTAGSYWNGVGCIDCEAGWYCPGNGQRYKCPFGGASTQNKASCVLNLNETQMEYNKCWLRYWNNAAAYRKCLYGIDLATLSH